MDVKSELDCLKNIPNINALSRNFIFIDDLILRENIAIVFQYIIFLINIEKKHILPGAISYLIYKDMIIHTASIAEAILCYGLKKSLEMNKASLELMGIVDKDSRYKGFKLIYTISTEKEIGSVIKTKQFINPEKMQFNDLISAALHISLIDKSLGDELTTIRKQRNNIHLSNFAKIDNGYTKQEVEKIFNTVYKLKKMIIKNLIL